MAWMVSEHPDLPENQDKSILELYVNTGPVYFELYRMTPNRFTIKQDTDHLKLHNCLEKWIKENILKIEHLDYHRNKRPLYDQFKRGKEGRSIDLNPRPSPRLITGQRPVTHFNGHFYNKPMDVTRYKSSAYLSFDKDDAESKDNKKNSLYFPNNSFVMDPGASSNRDHKVEEIPNDTWRQDLFYKTIMKTTDLPKDAYDVIQRQKYGHRERKSSIISRGRNKSNSTDRKSIVYVSKSPNRGNKNSASVEKRTCVIMNKSPPLAEDISNIKSRVLYFTPTKKLTERIKDFRQKFYKSGKSPFNTINCIDHSTEAKEVQNNFKFSLYDSQQKLNCSSFKNVSKLTTACKSGIKGYDKYAEINEDRPTKYLNKSRFSENKSMSIDINLVEYNEEKANFLEATDEKSNTKSVDPKIIGRGHSAKFKDTIDFEDGLGPALNSPIKKLENDRDRFLEINNMSLVESEFIKPCENPSLYDGVVANVTESSELMVDKKLFPRKNYIITCDWDGILKQFSLRDFIMHKSYNKIVKKGARQMVCTKDSQHQIISDMDGYIKHYTLEKNGEIKFRNFFKCHSTAIRAMCQSQDDQFLFTGSHDGVLKQHYIHPNSKMLLKRKDWSDVFINTSSIISLATTFDNTSVFMGDKEGILRQYSTVHYMMEKKYEFLGKHGAITTLVPTYDGKSLFIGYKSGFLRQIGVKSQRIEREYGWVNRGGIRSLFQTTDNVYLFVGASDGTLYQFDVESERTRCLMKDYGKVLDSNIFCLEGSDRYGYVWMADESGQMKVLDIREQIFVKSFVISSKAVYCMCMVNWV